MEREWKYGDVNPETGLIYWSKSNKDKTGHQWCSPEAFARRIDKRKEYQKSEQSKEYQKQWYQKNKLKSQEYSSKAYMKKREENPFIFLYYYAVQASKRKTRILEIDITPDYVKELWEQQKGRCFYTGLPMIISPTKKSPFHPSIDRRECSKGYIKGNVVICCQSINYAKSNYSENEFKEFLEALKLIP